MARRTPAPAVARWLLICAGLLVIITVVWAISWLTEYGLSLMEHNVPVDAPALGDPLYWRRDYSAYLHSPDSQPHRSPVGLSPADFRYLRFWGWLFSRLCLVGAVTYLLPWAYFSSADMVPRTVQPKLFLACGLGVFQAMNTQSMLPGWMMTRAIEGDTAVHTAHYQYTFDLVVAIAIFSTLTWTAMTLLPEANAPFPVAMATRTRPVVLAIVPCVVFTMITGGLTAGPDAGLVYNEWPALEGRLPPLYEFLLLIPGWRNALDSNAAMRGHHRLFAFTTLGLLIYLSRFNHSNTLPLAFARGLKIAQWTTVFQAWLGVVAVFYGPLVPLMALHQGVSFVLLAAVLWLTCLLRPQVSARTD